ncbi:hypothetical protein PUN4_430162 [Paraburkholderia unamae]|nr:hypothetical protein PUN4_430162 [Paraburkholderia unamae]
MPSSARQKASTGPQASSSTRSGATANTTCRAAATGEAWDVWGGMALGAIRKRTPHDRTHAHGSQVKLASISANPSDCDTQRFDQLWTAMPWSIVPYIVMPLPLLEGMEPPCAQAAHRGASATRAKRTRKRFMTGKRLA